MQTTPWWQQLMDGAEHGEAPSFLPVLGISPRAWDTEAGTVTVDWTPPDFTRTPGGWVQGGFLGVVLDFAQTFALFTKLPEGSMPQTLEMKISYLEGPFATAFVVTARALRWGKRAGHTDAELRDADGKLVATSTSTHVVRQAHPPA